MGFPDDPDIKDQLTPTTHSELGSEQATSSPEDAQPVVPNLSPLEVLLDPGMGMAARSAPSIDPLGTSSGLSMGANLTNMAQMQVLHLLELPELPVHRARRDGEQLPLQEDWRIRPPSERGRHDAPRPVVQEEEELEPLPPAEPRAYVVGQAYEDTLDASLQALKALRLSLPDIGTSSHIRLQVDLGNDEGAFLNAQSALWSWRPHRQSNVEVHTHGPPVVGRDVLLEQKIGMATVLQGCRVMSLEEEATRWGFTIGSLDGQVYRLWERLLIEQHANGRVILSISSHHEVALRGFGLLGPLLNNARRNTVQGYARSMANLAKL